MKFELWQAGTTFTLFQLGDEKNAALLEPEAKCIHTFEAGSWNEAQKLKHAFLGWEPYRAP